MDARLRALQPNHVPAYLTYALCDVRQTKRHSTTFQTIGVDLTSTIGSVGELLRYISELIAEKFQQGLKYLENLSSAWLASLEVLPDLQTLLGLTHKLYQMGQEVRVGDVSQLLATFFSSAAQTFASLQGSEGGSFLFGAIAQLTVNIGDFVAKFAETFVDVLKPLFEWVIRLASVVYDKFIQLTAAFGKITAHVVESLFLAGSEAATDLFYFIFAAGMELPKFVNVARSEIENYLKGVALQINTLLPSLVPRLWNAAQWIMEIEWIPRLAYYLKLPFARVYELVARISAYVQRLFAAMGRLALSYFNEIFGQLGHRLMEMVTPLLKPFGDFLNKEKTLMARLGLPEAKLREPMSAAQDLLERDRAGQIQLTPASKLRLQESIDVIQTFFKDMNDKQDARFRFLLKEPGSLYTIIQKKAALLKGLARATDLSTIKKTDEMDELVRQEFQMSLEEFSERYANLQGQIESALILAVMQLEEAWSMETSSPTTKSPDTLRHRRPVSVEPMIIENDVGATQEEILDLKRRIVALDRLIAEERQKTANSPIYQRAVRLEDFSLRELGADKVARAMLLIRAQAQFENNENWINYARMQQQLEDELRRKEAGLKARFGKITWLAVLMSLLIGASLLAWYYKTTKDQELLEATQRAKIKDDEFEQFTRDDPFLQHMRPKWQKSPNYLRSETDASSIGVTRMNDYADFLKAEAATLRKLSGKNPADMEEVRALGHSLWSSFLHDAKIASARYAQNKEDQNAGLLTYTWKSITNAWKTATGNIEGSPEYESLVYKEAWTTKLQIDRQLKGETSENVSLMDFPALPSSFVELATKFKTDKFIQGPAGYLETATEKVAALEASAPAPSIWGDGFKAWYAGSAKAADKADPFSANDRYLVDVQRLMAWRLDTMQASINLYKRISGAPPGLFGRVVNAVSGTAKSIVEEAAELTGVANVDSKAALDFAGGGAFKNLEVTVMRINPLNYIKLMAYYQWVGFTVALIGWILCSIIFLFSYFIIAAVFYREVSIAVAQVTHLLNTYVVPWAKYFLAMNLSSAFAYWSSRVAGLGIIYNILHFFYFGFFSKFNNAVGWAVGSTMYGLKGMGDFSISFFKRKFTKYEANNRGIGGSGPSDVPVIRQRPQPSVMGGGGGGWHQKTE